MQAREKISLITGAAIGRSRRLSGSSTVGRGKTRSVVVGDGGTVDAGENGGGVMMCRLKLRMLDADFDSESGDIAAVKEEKLLLREVLAIGDVAGLVVVAVVQILSLLADEAPDEAAEDELVLLLILRSLPKALMLLIGGLVAMIVDSLHICASGAAYSYVSALLAFLPR
jgi:hypothetical protein